MLPNSASPLSHKKSIAFIGNPASMQLEICVTKYIHAFYTLTEGRQHVGPL